MIAEILLSKVNPRHKYCDNVTYREIELEGLTRAQFLFIVNASASHFWAQVKNGALPNNEEVDHGVFKQKERQEA